VTTFSNQDIAPLYSEPEIVGGYVVPATMGDVWTVGNQIWDAVFAVYDPIALVVTALGGDDSQFSLFLQQLTDATGAVWQALASNLFNLYVGWEQTWWPYWVETLPFMSQACWVAVQPYLENWWDYGEGVALGYLAEMWFEQALEGYTADSWFDMEITNWWAAQQQDQQSTSVFSVAWLVEQVGNILAWIAGDATTAINAVLQVLPWLAWLAEHSLSDLIAFLESLPGLLDLDWVNTQLTGVTDNASMVNDTFEQMFG